MAFVLFSVAIFCGLTWGSQSLKLTANKYFSDYKLYDVQLSYKYGFDDSEIEILQSKPEIDEIEGAYQINEMFSFEGTTYQAVVNSITEKMNLLNQFEGNMPKSDSEVVLEKVWAKEHGINIGDEIVFKHDVEEKPHLAKALYDEDIDMYSFLDSDGMQYLKTDTFSVVGLVESPMYASRFESGLGGSTINSAPVNCAMFMTKDAFDADSFLGYPAVYIINNELSSTPYYTDEYKEKNEKLTEKVMDYAQEIADTKYQRLVENAKKYPTLVDPSSIVEEPIGNFTKLQNFSITYINLISEASGNLRYCLAFALLVIALLICYTVINRLVGEQSVLIGTKKALGFNDGEITKGFILYTLFAAIIGVILGVLVGRFGIAPLTLSVTRGIFTFVGATYDFSWLLSAISSVVCIIFVIIVTFLSCRKNLKRNALDLLTGNDEKKVKTRAYEKTKLWKKLPLFSKTMVNNLFTDKKRVISTLIGIMGVISLIICGLNFTFVVSKSSSDQFKNYQSFDYVLYYDETDSTCESNIKMILDEDEIPNARANYSNATLDVGGGDYEPISVIATSDDFSEMYKIVDVDDKKAENSIGDGVWLCEAIYRLLDKDIDDPISIIQSNGTKDQIKIDKVFKSTLIKPLVLMGDVQYETTFGKDYVPNVFLLASGDQDISKTLSKLEEVDGYICTSNFKEEEFSVLDNISSSFLAMSLVFVFIAIIMAFFVVMNLLVTFIYEKKKELITLMINGYELKDAKRYIYQDMIILSIIGIIIGCVAGTFLGILATKAVCVQFLYFNARLEWISIGLGILITVFFLTVVTLLSLRKIKKFDLTDIFK